MLDLSDIAHRSLGLCLFFFFNLFLFYSDWITSIDVLSCSWTFFWNLSSDINPIQWILLIFYFSVLIFSLVLFFLFYFGLRYLLFSLVMCIFFFTSLSIIIIAALKSCLIISISGLSLRCHCLYHGHWEWYVEETLNSVLVWRMLTFWFIFAGSLIWLDSKCKHSVL